MFQFEQILLQALMVLFPIVLYLATFNDHANKKKKQFIFALICALTTSLSLMVAIEIDEGIILDLRMVPWYVAFMYGGNLVGLAVTGFYFIVRYFIGGMGMIVAFSVLIVTTSIIQIFLKPYQGWPLRRKILFSVSFIVLSSIALPILGSFILEEPFTYTRLIIYSFFVIESGVVVWLIIFLIESHNEKLQLFQDIQKTEKLNVVGQLAASVAHEIRNPMTSVRGFIQLLSNSENISKKEKQYVNLCLEELDRANSIIGDYLSLGKDTNTTKVEKLDLSIELKRSINTIISYANLRNTEISFDNNFSVYIEGNSGRIQQLFINLLKNGIEAIEENGTIVVELSSTKKDAIVTITDNGVGMKQKQIENLGLPFYSTKEKGTGLGLMVCLSIVKDLGGKLHVRSNEGIGTTFVITFPLKV